MKCINGEKATYNTRVFSSKRERTYQILLEDAGAAYGREQGAKQGAGLVDTIETGGVLGIRSIHATFLQFLTQFIASTQLLTKLCELQKREITDNIQNTEW